MTLEEAVRARRAALALERLYNAYRATSRAHAMVLLRIGADLDGGASPLGERQRRLKRRVSEDLAVARETDRVFRERAEQIARRVDELDRFGAP